MTMRTRRHGFTYGDLYDGGARIADQDTSTPEFRYIDPSTILNNAAFLKWIKDNHFSVALDSSYNGLAQTDMARRTITLNPAYDNQTLASLLRHELGHLMLFDVSAFTSISRRTLRSTIAEVIYTPQHMLDYSMVDLLRLENIIQDIIIETIQQPEGCVCQTLSARYGEMAGVKHLDSIEHIATIAREACANYLSHVPKKTHPKPKDENPETGSESEPESSADSHSKNNSNDNAKTGENDGKVSEKTGKNNEDSSVQNSGQNTETSNGNQHQPQSEGQSSNQSGEGQQSNSDDVNDTVGGNVNETDNNVDRPSEERSAQSPNDNINDNVNNETVDTGTLSKLLQSMLDDVSGDIDDIENELKKQEKIENSNPEDSPYKEKVLSSLVNAASKLNKQKTMLEKKAASLTQAGRPIPKAISTAYGDILGKLKTNEESRAPDNLDKAAQELLDSTIRRLHNKLERATAIKQGFNNALNELPDNNAGASAAANQNTGDERLSAQDVDDTMEPDDIGIREAPGDNDYAMNREPDTHEDELLDAQSSIDGRWRHNGNDESSGTDSEENGEKERSVDNQNGTGSPLADNSANNDEQSQHHVQDQQITADRSKQDVNDGQIDHSADMSMPLPITVRRDDHHNEHNIFTLDSRFDEHTVHLTENDMADIAAGGNKSSEWESSYFKTAKREIDNTDMMRGHKRRRKSGIGVLIGLDISGSMTVEWMSGFKDIAAFLEDLKNSLDIDRVTYFTYDDSLREWSDDISKLTLKPSGGNAFPRVYQQMIRHLPIMQKNEIILVTDCGDNLGFKLEKACKVDRNGEDVINHVSIVNTQNNGFYDKSSFDSEQWSLIGIDDLDLNERLQQNMENLIDS